MQETKKRLLNRLDEGETVDQLFHSLYNARDIQGMDHVDSVAAYHARDQGILQKWARQEKATEWLAKDDLFNWEKEMLKV